VQYFVFAPCTIFDAGTGIDYIKSVEVWLSKDITELAENRIRFYNWVVLAFVKACRDWEDFGKKSFILSKISIAQYLIIKATQ